MKLSIRFLALILFANIFSIFVSGASAEESLENTATSLEEKMKIAQEEFRALEVLAEKFSSEPIYLNTPPQAPEKPSTTVGTTA